MLPVEVFVSACCGQVPKRTKFNTVYGSWWECTYCGKPTAAIPLTEHTYYLQLQNNKDKLLTEFLEYLQYIHHITNTQYDFIFKEIKKYASDTFGGYFNHIRVYARAIGCDMHAVYLIFEVIAYQETQEIIEKFKTRLVKYIAKL